MVIPRGTIATHNTTTAPHTTALITLDRMTDRPNMPEDMIALPITIPDSTTETPTVSRDPTRKAIEEKNRVVKETGTEIVIVSAIVSHVITTCPNTDTALTTEVVLV